ncbi:MAG: lipoyl synthase [Elusimicrobia bacterium]|nr:lipoyl synthase [Elusimicrobiota bacterium]
MAPAAERALPPWLKVKLPAGPVVARLKDVSRSRGLSTVCEEARCPNLAECWGGGTATFMAMGGECTRGCRFCSVGTALKPPPPDPEEPAKLALTLKEMAIDYAVLTTVCRDDLADQGAAHLAACVRAIKAECPDMKLEILAQDFRGDKTLLEAVLDAGPDVLAHNVECVERLTPAVRDAKAGYRQSLDILAHARAYRPQSPTKSSLMLGLGETEAELRQAFADLRAAGVEILTLGQYLRPTGSGHHLAVERFVPPEEFERLGDAARSHGFRYVASGPFVRSSYRAAELFLTGRLESSLAA